jgi:hypothetical protein
VSLVLKIKNLGSVFIFVMLIGVKFITVGTFTVFIVHLNSVVMLP